MRKGSASFLKKRSKKLFLTWAVLVSLPPAQPKQKFLLSFFQKAALSFYYPSSRPITRAV
jgi:hypothetical protein